MRSDRIGGIPAQFNEWIETLSFRGLLLRFPRAVGLLQRRSHTHLSGPNKFYESVIWLVGRANALSA